MCQYSAYSVARSNSENGAKLCKVIKQEGGGDEGSVKNKIVTPSIQVQCGHNFCGTHCILCTAFTKAESNVCRNVP